MARPLLSRHSAGRRLDRVPATREALGDDEGGAVRELASRAVLVLDRNPSTDDDADLRMSSAETAFLSATEAVSRLRSGALKPTELLEAIIQRIEAVNPVVNAFTELWIDEARASARESDRRYESGTARELEGVVLAVKDSTPLRGRVHTLGSALLTDNVAARTHPGLQRMIDAGVVMVGRTTMPEFGEAGNCYTPQWGVTRNPWNLEYGPGGSSSGAAAALAAALAAGMTTLADGSDIGGSSRIPASCCGVYGYKPPYGRNPNTYEGSFDPYLHYGPLARTVADIVLMQRVIAGQSLEDIGTLRETISLPDRAPDPSGGGSPTRRRRSSS
jgi:Asp-tRNA(Asn)/Glu-tRNA(Gln) amidotransferase A subunit family amidase